MKQNWEVKKWKDVIDIRSGRNQTEVENPNGNYPILGSAGKIMGYADKYICEEGTTIIGRKGTINNPLFIKTKFWNVDTAFGLHALEGLDKMFLFYFCRNYDFTKQDKGSGRPSLVKSDLLQIEIPLPQLQEQQRIVSILDKAFSTIEKAKDNTEQNLKNARELFESELQRIYSEKGEDWVDCNLEDNIKLIDYRGRTPVKTESGVRLITAKNVKLGYLQLEPQEFINAEDYASWMRRGIPNYGDVIFTTEAPLANVAQIETTDKLAFAQRIIVMQPKKEKLNQTFLKYMLLSSPIRNKILEKGTGATVMGIKSSLLKKIEISFPKSLKEQQTIVSKLDALREQTKKLEAVYTQKLQDLEELKKSVLKKAFSGEFN